MLANHYGHAITQREIASAIYFPAIRGTLTADLAGYAQRFGLWTWHYRGSRADLHEKLAAGIPLIVLGRLGDRYHYFIVLDYRGDMLTVHSDTRANLQMREDDFLRWWNQADRWTLLVCPPEKATWRLSAEEHNDLGVFLERSNKPAEAAEHYRAALSQRPSNAYFALNLGNALRKQGKLRDAESAFALAPDNADALNNRADVLCELGERLDDAAQMCQQALKLMPGHRAYYLDTLGGVLLKQGKTAEAVKAFEDALAATTDRQETLRSGIRDRLAKARAQLR